MRKANEALDRMAENARELGLDYEPAQPKYRRGDRLICLETEEYCVIHISGTDRQWVKFPDTHIGVYKNEQLAELFELLPKEIGIEQPAQQEPVAKVCHDLDGHIGWNPNLRQLPDEGTALYAAPPAQRPHECSRSHPHENMDAMCELRTEIARLTNENARLKALHQDDEINTYRMTLLCIRDGLQQGMSKSIQKLQAREINDVLGLPSFASYRTSPPAQRKPLTDEEIIKCWGQVSGTRYGYVAFARAIEAAHGIKENT